MRYEDTNEQERELILFIENNEEAFKLVTKHAAEKPRTLDAVNAAVMLYKREYASAQDEIFTLKERRNVRNYFRDQKPYSTETK